MSAVPTGWPDRFPVRSEGPIFFLEGAPFALRGVEGVDPVFAASDLCDLVRACIGDAWGRDLEARLPRFFASGGTPEQATLVKEASDRAGYRDPFRFVYDTLFARVGGRREIPDTEPFAIAPTEPPPRPPRVPAAQTEDGGEWVWVEDDLERGAPLLWFVAVTGHGYHFEHPDDAHACAHRLRELFVAPATGVRPALYERWRAGYRPPNQREDIERLVDLAHGDGLILGAWIWRVLFLEVWRVLGRTDAPPAFRREGR